MYHQGCSYRHAQTDASYWPLVTASSSALVCIQIIRQLLCFLALSNRGSSSEQYFVNFV